MKIVKTHIPDLVELEPQIFGDARGYFFEPYNKQRFHEAGIKDEFVQDNQSLSNRGVLRGLHFQKAPFAQGKLVRVVTGAVLDVAVDIRIGSPTYGKHHKVLLTEENKKMFWVPPGFAHGFLTLKDNTIFSYKCTNLYNKESEGSVLWNDKELDINWEIDDPILSEKDKVSPSFAALKSTFNYV